MSITAEDIINTLEFVNSYREAAGLPTLADLPQGLPGDSKHCILAKAFNFEGDVNGSDGCGGWYFEAQLPEDKAKTLKEWAEKELPDERCVYTGSIPKGVVHFRLYLPEEIAKIAVAFDGHDPGLAKYVAHYRGPSIEIMA